MMREHGRTALFLISMTLVVACVAPAATSPPPAATASPFTAPPPTVSPVPSASSPTAVFRKQINDAINQLNDPWALFCVTRGHIERTMPPPQDLAGLDSDSRIPSATDILIELGTPPPGWLEVGNAAHDVGVTAADAVLAEILIRAQIEQGVPPSGLADDWAEKVLLPCDTVRDGIQHVRELLDQLP